MLFGPGENFGDFGLVEDESVRGADVADGVIVDSFGSSRRVLPTLLLSEGPIFTMVCCAAMAPEGDGKLPNGVNGCTHPAIRGERDAGFPVGVVEAYGV